MPCWCNGQCPHKPAANFFVKEGKAGRAQVLLRGALLAAPYCPEANLMLAGMLRHNNNAQAAEVHVDRAARYGDPARVAYERAAIYRAQVDLARCLPACREALDLAVDNPNASAAFISTLEVAGELEEAALLAAAARARFPDNAEVRRAQGVVLASQGLLERAIAVFSSPGEEMTAPEYLERGRCFEKLGNHVRAWDDWNTGKTIARERLNHRYNATYFQKTFAALAEAAAPARMEFVRPAPPEFEGPGPIFVCGFPRSGTTLTETILSRHSQVVAGDELQGIAEVIAALPGACKVRAPYPRAMMATSLGENADVMLAMREIYLRGAWRRIGWAPAKGRKAPRYFTDKMPLNEIHLPLIRALFPNAPVIRLVRHPLDVMVSCMSQWLAHGGFFGSSLQAAAQHYLAVDALVQGYDDGREAFGGFLFQVSYELLVADQKGITRWLLDKCGLKYEAATLAPHKNGRTARTLSYNQVRQPVNDKSIGRWKNFREQLAPAVEILRPILERDGYEF